jgi:hypothetical protein
MGAYNDGGTPEPLRRNDFSIVPCSEPEIRSRAQGGSRLAGASRPVGLAQLGSRDCIRVMVGAAETSCVLTEAFERQPASPAA